ncbi:pentapeptide repeat-containing protein [Paracoccus lutimaris]|uniref:Pentapeptide repeat protein n=1 Tax=Paracoccus lutimaris TaxID=1490030 RepID=A0A368Z877_9RHOB|nr:pentapeptide repeat-containing protein [Paracoccus lutimaris]RCW88660.1 pentapeptide repeat protein [Paracoccus lutimaris]
MAEFTRADIMRKIGTTGRLEMAGKDMAGLDLSGLTMVGADLSYTDLRGADLSGAQLSGASLWSAKAKGANFRGANLVGASLGLADLAGADLRGAQLERADLTGTRLDGADLTDARLRGAWLDTMQRALAIGAPPLRYPARQGPSTCILHEDHMNAPVALRCGDRLEVHLRNEADPAARKPGLARIEGAQILSGSNLPCAVEGPVYVLAFDAVAPGRARMVVERGEGRAPIAFDVLVTP